MSAKQSRIVEVIAYEVVVPAREGSIDSHDIPSPNAYGRWDLMPIVLLQLRDDDGFVGLGEAPRNWTIAALEPWLKQVAGMRLSPFGPTVDDLPATWVPSGVHGGSLLEPHPPSCFSSPCPLWPALETAAVDIAGKRLGCRAVDLFGGAVRKYVSVDFWAGRQTPRDLQRTVERARAMGFSGLKIKSRLGDPTLLQARAVRDAGGIDFELTIDPMFQWLAPRHVMATMRGLESLGSVIRIEDPFPQDRPDQWRRLQKLYPIPLIWHARTAPVLRTALQENCFDALNLGGGSVREALSFAAAAAAVGHDCWMGSGLELGIMQAARLHACAAAPACVMPSDLQGPLVREAHLTDWPWAYSGGTLPLPEGTGLGVSLDHSAVERYQRATAVFQC